MSCGLALAAGSGEVGFVDGGVPHYGYGAILNLSLPSGCKLFDASGNVIGEVYSSSANFSLFKAACRAYVGGVEVKGFGSYINQPLLKVIKTPSWTCKVGDVVELNFKFDSSLLNRKKGRRFKRV